MNDCSRDFLVKAPYSVIQELRIGDGEEVQWNKIWDIEIPPKGAHMIWRAMLDRMATRDNLLHRGINLVNTNCPICHQQGESFNHIIWKSNTSCKCTLRQIYMQIMVPA